MKSLLKVTLFLLIQFLPVILLAQAETPPPYPDEGMDIFLRVLAGIFIFAMLGAAAVGAFLAALVVLFSIGLYSFGLLSASFAVGLYRRSVSAGFKSLLMLFFGTACSFFGWVSLVAFNFFVPLPLSSLQLFLAGLTAGTIGGILLALTTYRVILSVFRWMVQRSGVR